MVTAWKLEPRGELRSDLRSALQIAQIAMLAGTKQPIPFEQLMLQIDPELPEDAETSVSDPVQDDPDDVADDVNTLRAWIAGSRRK